MSTFTTACLVVFGVFAALVLVSAAVGGFFAVTKGEPPPYEPPLDDRADWPDAS